MKTKQTKKKKGWIDKQLKGIERKKTIIKNMK